MHEETWLETFQKTPQRPKKLNKAPPRKREPLDTRLSNNKTIQDKKRWSGTLTHYFNVYHVITRVILQVCIYIYCIYFLYGHACNILATLHFVPRTLHRKNVTPTNGRQATQTWSLWGKKSTGFLNMSKNFMFTSFVSQKSHLTCHDVSWWHKRF